MHGFMRGVYARYDEHWSPVPPEDARNAVPVCMRGRGWDALSSLEGVLSASQLRSTTRCSIGGCSFRVICLTTVDHMP